MCDVCRNLDAVNERILQELVLQHISKVSYATGLVFLFIGKVSNAAGTSVATHK